MKTAVIVFVNSRDQHSRFLGKALYTLLSRQYYIFSRFESQFPMCRIENTLAKIKEVVQNTGIDRIIVSFGVRLLPSNLSSVEKLIEKRTDNLVFLKKLRGSKTWSLVNGRLSFDNYRIADTGIFILNSEDVLQTKENHFNKFIRDLIVADKLKPVFVKWWVFSNSRR
ncbi:MAG: hypothetical protein DRP74_09375 [Candidatus Omnitrophota bacterium]|nr:MAG: hypothetical protein DRP74_09375 [Candidatus Omnitrophota bacterium]